VNASVSVTGFQTDNRNQISRIQRRALNLGLSFIELNEIILGPSNVTPVSVLRRGGGARNLSYSVLHYV
jgi:hypothetical protein